MSEIACSLRTKNGLAAKISRAALVTAILLTAGAGCETGTTHKTNLGLDLSDVTTTPPPAAHADATNAPAGKEPATQPPVPGSPTASNADGTQPPDDAQARNSSVNQHPEAPSGKYKP